MTTMASGSFGSVLNGNELRDVHEDYRLLVSLHRAKESARGVLQRWCQNRR